MAKLQDLVRHMDALLDHENVGDYPGARGVYEIDAEGRVQAKRKLKKKHFTFRDCLKSSGDGQASDRQAR